MEQVQTVHTQVHHGRMVREGAPEQESKQEGKWSQAGGGGKRLSTQSHLSRTVIG